MKNYKTYNNINVGCGNGKPYHKKHKMPYKPRACDTCHFHINSDDDTPDRFGHYSRGYGFCTAGNGWCSDLAPCKHYQRKEF